MALPAWRFLTCEAVSQFLWQEMTMDLGLRGQVVVVVGGASGIGLAIARGFQEEGSAVAIIDRLPAVCDIAADMGREFEGSASGHVCDVTDLAMLERVAEEIAQVHGRCDHVCFAAGIGSGKFGFPFWEVDPADWPRILEVNLVGAVNVAHVFRQSLIERQGTLIMLSSVAGQIGSQTDPPYSASKAGLINFMQCAAKDLAPYGVRVNAVNPGMVQTPLNRSVYDAWAARQPEDQRPGYESWAAQKIRQMVPLNRWQTPEDIAAMAVFLSSPRTRNVTGQTINVDGGFVMHW
jgi:NAD(P)-dependent dehydrogenase (short-subunit alcohol dehydrogenase family)